MKNLFRTSFSRLAFCAAAGIALLVAASIPPVLAGEELAGRFGPTLADMLPKPFDMGSLLIVEDRAYRTEVEPWVDQDPISTSTVRKIEAGRTRFVTITTTSTGTYSSDALTSPHVRYPGIHVEDLGSVAWIWSSTEGGWTALPLLSLSSVTVLSSSADSHVWTRN